MTFGELLALVVERLDRAGIPFMVTGSLASSYHGEPRSTRDVDIVIDPEPASRDQFVEDLVSAGFYVDRETAREALANRSQFDAIGPAAAKVDFIIRRERPFSLEEFGRRQHAKSSWHGRVRGDAGRPRDRQAGVGGGVGLRPAARRCRRHPGDRTSARRRLHRTVGTRPWSRRRVASRPGELTFSRSATPKTEAGAIARLRFRRLVAARSGSFAPAPLLA